jgi:HTH-type transcriptional regulator/antitoxin HipB
VHILCGNSDNIVLFGLAHIFNLCSNSDIDYSSDLDHNPPMMELARTPRQIGNLVRSARKRRGWSQTQLGERTGLRQETISLIETGNPATRLETILAVLAALDLEFRLAARSKGQPSDIETLF